MKTVIIGPTGSHLRTVNVSTGPSGATGIWATASYAATGPTGRFETVKVAAERSNKFKSVVISGFTGTVTPDPEGDEDEPPGVPEWVPANAKIYIDLVNDRAWTEADGEVEIDTLLGADANTVNGWGASSYDAGNLTADGYIDPAPVSPIAFLTGALSKILDEVTITVRVKQITESPSGCPFFALLSANGNDAVEWFTSAGNLNVAFDSYAGPMSGSIPSIRNSGVGAINVIATTIAGSRFEIAANGSDATSGVISSTDRPSGNPLVAAVVGTLAALQSITIYDALPTTAGLSELSRIIPEDAKIHINFVQNWAWTEADGEVAINMLLGTDANTENAFNVSEYDAANLTADGYVDFDSVLIAFIGAARTKVLAGSTIVSRFKQPIGGSGALGGVELMAADGNDALQLQLLDSGVASVISFSGDLNLTIPSIVNVLPGTAINVFAATITGTRAEFAVNGSDAESGVAGEDDRPSGNPFVASVIYSGVGAVQSITIYDALPSTAGLSALSETGVTNTAPTNVFYPGETDLQWVAKFVGSTVSESDISGESYPLTIAVNVRNGAGTDPEGNPCTVTLSDDSGGIFTFSGDNLKITEALVVASSPYTFTLRATDPGGLYVEQEFTITVTA